MTRVHLNSGLNDFITDLGKDFLSQIFYPEILKSEWGFGYVYLIDGKVAGFITGSLDSARYYKKMMRRKCPLLISLVFGKLLKNPLFFKDVIQATLFSLKCTKPPVKPDLSYIAVDSKFQGKGIGKQLVMKLIEHLKNNNLAGCWTKTEKENIRSNRLYKKCGFKIFRETKFRNRTVALYVIDWSLS